MRSVDNIDEILCDLNDEVDNHSAGVGSSYGSKDFDMMSRFTYESAGYYCWIKFGDEILWDSENEPRKWIEETDDYEDLTTFIKKEYNRYVNTLMKFKFYDVERDIKNLVLNDTDKLLEFINEHLTEDDAYKVYDEMIEMIKNQKNYE